MRPEGIFLFQMLYVAGAVLSVTRKSLVETNEVIAEYVEDVSYCVLEEQQ
jgi:hypothetical protein